MLDVMAFSYVEFKEAIEIEAITQSYDMEGLLSYWDSYSCFMVSGPNIIVYCTLQASHSGALGKLRHKTNG